MADPRDNFLCTVGPRPVIGDGVFDNPYRRVDGEGVLGIVPHDQDFCLCHVHEVLCEAFRRGHGVFQVNATDLCNFGLHMRRIVQIERAVLRIRCRDLPGPTGLSVVLSTVEDRHDAIQVKGFHRFLEEQGESYSRVFPGSSLDRYNAIRSPLTAPERLYYDWMRGLAAARRQQRGGQSDSDSPMDESEIEQQRSKARETGDGQGDHRKDKK